MWDIWIEMIIVGFCLSTFVIIDRDLSIQPAFSKRQTIAIALFGFALEAIGLIGIWRN